MGKIFIIIFIVIIIIALFPKSNDQQLGAEFNSMSSCLEGIKQNSRLNIDNFTKNTSDLVSGYLGNGKQFICEKKESGSKGIYYLGTYWKDN